MKLVFLIIYLSASGPVLEIKPMPSMQVCQLLGQQIDQWLSRRTNGRNWTCVEIET